MQAQQVLRQRFPGMEVVPSTYPVSAQRVGYLPRPTQLSPSVPSKLANFWLCQGHQADKLRGCLPLRHCRAACIHQQA